jgi:phosphoribosylformylglycinamidine cyclo-ligase
MELYLPEEFSDKVIAISKSFGIEAQIVGFVEASEKEELVIEGENGRFEYK